MTPSQHHVFSNSQCAKLFSSVLQQSNLKIMNQKNGFPISFKLKLFLIGILIYLIPLFAFWAFAFVSYGFFSTSLDIILLAVIFYPVILFGSPLLIFRIGLACYYLFAYGLLIWFWRRNKRGSIRH